MYITFFNRAKLFAVGTMKCILCVIFVMKSTKHKKKSKSNGSTIQLSFMRMITINFVFAEWFIFCCALAFPVNHEMDISRNENNNRNKMTHIFFRLKFFEVVIPSFSLTYIEICFIWSLFFASFSIFWTNEQKTAEILYVCPITTKREHKNKNEKKWRRCECNRKVRNIYGLMNI